MSNIATLARTIFDQPGADEVAAQFGRVVTALEGKLPAAAEHLAAARDDLLAFTAVPREIWRQIWSSTPQERLNRELRRRTGVVGIFLRVLPLPAARSDGRLLPLSMPHRRQSVVLGKQARAM